MSLENETSSLAARLAEQSNRRRVLGIAAGLLFGFFLIGRTMELAAALDATPAEDRQRRTLAR